MDAQCFLVLKYMGFPSPFDSGLCKKQHALQSGCVQLGTPEPPRCSQWGTSRVGTGGRKRCWAQGRGCPWKPGPRQLQEPLELLLKSREWGGEERLWGEAPWLLSPQLLLQSEAGRSWGPMGCSRCFEEPSCHSPVSPGLWACPGESRNLRLHSLAASLALPPPHPSVPSRARAQWEQGLLMCATSLGVRVHD